MRRTASDGTRRASLGWIDRDAVVSRSFVSTQHGDHLGHLPVNQFQNRVLAPGLFGRF